MGLLTRAIDKRIANYQRELLEAHFAEVETMYRKMRGWRHDYRNHIQAMRAHVAADDMGAIARYLDELDTDLATVDTVIKTGNAMTDAILNSKISLARSKGITVIADAHIPIKLSVSELELCRIIGNLFDNAIDAVLPLPENERIIRVYMSIKGVQLYISVTNMTAQKKQVKVGGRFASTKGKGRGFGLLSIDSIVERLGGYLERASEDGAFTTEILLPL